MTWSKALSLPLLILSVSIFIGLCINQPVWLLIGFYWLLVSLKNLAEVTEHDDCDH